MDPVACVSALLDALDERDPTSFDLLFDALIVWLETDGFVPDNVSKLVEQLREFNDLGDYADSLCAAIDDNALRAIGQRFKVNA